MRGRLRTLAVEADLTLDVEGEQVRVHGDGADVFVDLPRLGTARKLFQALPGSGDRTRPLNRAHRLLRDTGLTAHVRVRGATVARLGAAARPGAWTRLLRLGEAEVRPGVAVSSSVRRTPRWAWIGGLAAAALTAWLLWSRRGD